MARGVSGIDDLHNIIKARPGAIRERGNGVVLRPARNGALEFVTFPGCVDDLGAQPRVAVFRRLAGFGSADAREACHLFLTTKEVVGAFHGANSNLWAVAIVHAHPARLVAFVNVLVAYEAILNLVKHDPSLVGVCIYTLRHGVYTSQGHSQTFFGGVA